MTYHTIRRKAVADVIYVIVGLAGLMMVPRLFEDFRVSTHRTHPTGA